MKNHFALYVLILLSISSVYSQSLDLGSWNVLNIKYNLDQKWNVFGEAQLRSLKLYDDFHYYEYKVGVTLKKSKNIAFTLGLGKYQTFKEGGNFVLPKNNNEFRFWPQIVLFQSLGVLKIEQRYRTELRYTTNGYKNRFRYRMGISYPFGKKKNDYKPFQISASNELFFTNNEPYFERNRMLLALNYKLTNATTLQIGYLHQFDYKINDETGKDFFQIGYFLELFRNSTSVSNSEIDIKDN